MNMSELINNLKEIKSHSAEALHNLICSKIDWKQLREEFEEAGFSDFGFYWEQGFDEDISAFMGQFGNGDFIWLEFEGRVYTGGDELDDLFSEEDQSLINAFNKIYEGHPEIEALGMEIEGLPDEILEELGHGAIRVYEDRLELETGR